MGEDDKFEVGVGPAKISGSGRAVARIGDSIADLLSPFAQGFGLVGDHIRIHRERSVASVLEKAKQIADARGAKISAVNPKNLVPLLENSSLEDPSGDGLTELWARLLLSGDETFDSEMAQYADSLKRIGKRDAEFLRRLCVESPTFPTELATDRLLRQNRQFVSVLARSIRWEEGESALSERINEFNREHSLHYGHVFEAWVYKDKRSKETISFFEVGVEHARVLEKEQLARVVHVEVSEHCDAIVTFSDLTAWGVRLVKRCYPELVAKAEAERSRAAGAP